VGGVFPEVVSFRENYNMMRKSDAR
jgi:hypothetical protein